MTTGHLMEIGNLACLFGDDQVLASQGDPVTYSACDPFMGTYKRTPDAPEMAFVRSNEGPSFEALPVSRWD